MNTIANILNKAGGWRPYLYLRIENAPYMALVIEAMGEPGPTGLRALSVAHYGEQNGDLMRDPEMCFELRTDGGCTTFSPFYWRNDYVAIEQWSRNLIGGRYVTHQQLHQQHTRFAATWDKNLRHQRFADVFDPKKHVCG